MEKQWERLPQNGAGVARVGIDLYMECRKHREPGAGMYLQNNWGSTPPAINAVKKKYLAACFSQ